MERASSATATSRSTRPWSRYVELPAPQEAASGSQALAPRNRTLEEKSALTRDFGREVMPLFASGRVAPVLDRVFPMTAVAEAHRVMEANAHFGKIVLRWDESQDQCAANCVQ